MTFKEAVEITGGLSAPSKMPGYAFNLPASSCITGSKLCKLKGTVCSTCYARKGRYRFPNVLKALHKRLSGLNHPQWVEAMVFLLKRTKEPYFRWHDSGDLQSIQHLENIIEVVKQTPEINHWLPTKEYDTVRSIFVDQNHIPVNLCIRFSIYFVDELKRDWEVTPPWPVIATVATTDQIYDMNFLCPVNDHPDKTCGSCRACWDMGVPNITYLKH